MSLIASVIVPVYNKETFLQSCLDCLDNQTLSHSQFEAIFVDDGSNDSSYSYLQEAARTRQWLSVLHQNNRGVQEARNAGIKHAQGNYIFYLDPDDTISNNTLKDVSEFFQDHIDEVDLVTYPIVPFEDGKRKSLHSRYTVLDKTGIYDLYSFDSFKICQTTMNICVKNKFENNQLFDFEAPNGIIFHEDEFYIAKVLMQKMKIGFFKGAEYHWIKNEASVTSSKVKALYIYDNTINAYEKLFSSFPDKVPRYFQGLLANDLGWTMRCNAALPIHLQHNHAQYKQEMNRLGRLLDHVEDDVLIGHPNIHSYHALYFIKLKTSSKISAAIGPAGVALINKGKVISANNTIEILILKTHITDSFISLDAFIKSPVFDFIEKSRIQLQVTIKSNTGSDKTIVPKLNVSSWSRIACKSKVATFYDFHLDSRIDIGDKLNFNIFIDGVSIPSFITSSNPFSNFNKEQHFCVKRDEKCIALNRSKCSIAVIRDNGNTNYGNFDQRHRVCRKLIEALYENNKKKGRQVWLYCDAKGRLDNAWHQFVHDCSINDNVERFYISNSVSPRLPDCSSHAHIIAFGSRLHMILHYAADLILASDVDSSCWRPRSSKTDAQYRDIFHARLVYLQHGVLWAHMPWYYSKDRLRFDKEVISTDFERHNLVENYGFDNDDLIQAGMPRYDFINNQPKPTNKILFCPSWRNYLIGSQSANGRQPLEQTFIGSEYFKRIIAFLNSKQLDFLLKDSNFTLDFQLHPNFSCYKQLFKTHSESINVVTNASIENYSIGITDYSSMSFDFLYLNRPLVYFVPDYDLFKAGINHYNQLDIPLDDAFGELALTADDAIAALERIIKNNCKPLQPYQKKYENLFSHNDCNQRERIYKALFSYISS